MKTLASTPPSPFGKSLHFEFVLDLYLTIIVIYIYILNILMMYIIFILIYTGVLGFFVRSVADALAER